MTLTIGRTTAVAPWCAISQEIGRQQRRLFGSDPVAVYGIGRTYRFGKVSMAIDFTLTPPQRELQLGRGNGLGLGGIRDWRNSPCRRRKSGRSPYALAGTFELKAVFAQGGVESRSKLVTDSRNRQSEKQTWPSGALRPHVIATQRCAASLLSRSGQRPRDLEKSTKQLWYY